MKLLKHKYLNIVWTALRIWLGYQLISSGLEKVTGSGLIGSTAGTSITGFLKGSLAKAGGAHPAVQSWYADFIKNIALPNATTFSYLVAFGELLAGISLILGALTVVGLLAGALMNLNYMLAGTTSTNPIMYTVAFILLFVGANAYSIGLDHFILPNLKIKFNKKSNPISNI